MYLTQQTDYALRVLMYTANHQPQQTVNIAAIARDYQISKSHVMKVVTALVKGGFLHSLRGKGGGLRLARAADGIYVGDVVQHMEAMELVECMRPDGHCLIAANCKLPKAFSAALQAFIASLNQYTLAMLLHRPLTEQFAQLQQK